MTVCAVIKAANGGFLFIYFVYLCTWRFNAPPAWSWALVVANFGGSIISENIIVSMKQQIRIKCVRGLMNERRIVNCEKFM